jgi:hypothetical protein
MGGKSQQESVDGKIEKEKEKSESYAKERQKTCRCLGAAASAFSRVTGCACEKIAQNTAQPIFCQNRL